MAGEGEGGRGWEDVPREIRCVILSYLRPKEIGLAASLVSKSFYEAAAHDDVWRYLCQHHFPHHDTDITSEFMKESPSTKAHFVSEKVTDLVFPSWKERYRNYAHRLFVIHHKYNDINEGAMQDAILKWKQAGAVVTDVLASTDEFLEPKINEWMSDMRQVMRRHRVLYIFTDGGMKDWLRHPLGDALADFVEEGNAVIVGTFSNVAKRERPGGRWETENYNPLESESQVNGTHDLGKIHIPDHPIMKNITRISSTYKAVGKVNPKGKAIAAYDHQEEYLLVAEMPVVYSGKKGMVLSVNIYLPSSDSPLVGWRNEAGNQVVALHGNILHHAVRQICFDTH